MAQDYLLDFAVTGTIDPAFGRATYLFSAIGDARVVSSSEMTAEPGVAGRPGPHLARRMEIRVALFDDGGGVNRSIAPRQGSGSISLVDMNVRGKESQAAILDLLRNKPVKLSFRTHPVEDVTWCIENVTIDDSYGDSNGYSAKVSVVEWVGHDQLGPNGFVSLEETTIAALGLETVEGNASDDIHEATGSEELVAYVFVSTLNRNAPSSGPSAGIASTATARIISRWASSQVVGQSPYDDEWRNITRLFTNDATLLKGAAPASKLRLTETKVRRISMVDVPKFPRLSDGDDSSIAKCVRQAVSINGASIEVIYDFKGGAFRLGLNNTTPLADGKSLTAPVYVAYPHLGEAPSFPLFFDPRKGYTQVTVAIVDAIDPSSTAAIGGPATFASSQGGGGAEKDYKLILVASTT